MGALTMYICSHVSRCGSNRTSDYETRSCRPTRKKRSEAGQLCGCGNHKHFCHVCRKYFWKYCYDINTGSAWGFFRKSGFNVCDGRFHMVTDSGHGHFGSGD